MSDNNNSSQIPSTFLTVLQNTLEGGALRLIASKPVQEAIGRLVSGATDIPVAYLESISRRKRRETEAKDRVYAAIADGVATKAANDEALIDRSLERWTREITQKQLIREKVAINTAKYLADIEDEDLQNAKAPFEDWMLVFEDMVEKTSSEELADLMARILAGKICKPSSISRRLLQTVAILDREIVQALIELQPYLLNGGWWIVPDKRLSDWQEKFSLLTAASITGELGPRHFGGVQDGQAVIAIGNKGILVREIREKFPPFLTGVNLTPTGMELISVLPPPVDNRIEEILAGLIEDGWYTNCTLVTL